MSGLYVLIMNKDYSVSEVTYHELTKYQFYYGPWFGQKLGKDKKQ